MTVSNGMDLLLTEDLNDAKLGAVPVDDVGIFNTRKVASPFHRKECFSGSNLEMH